MTTAEYVRWAHDNCPEPLQEVRSSFAQAWAEYEEVDRRLGDQAEHNDFLTRVMWMEITIRAHRLGWTVEDLEQQRWPLPGTARIGDVLSRS